ncbi:MAG: LysM peptidoglycan-binding domain-containing protein [Myxococcaceae bacterium]|nr:LysM peptidoglycan-binding domain-containing protein [Myxococcaceae bacterium]
MDYRIRSGDTLTALARKFGTTVEKLAQANGIADPNKIYAGRTLKIPDGFDPERPPEAPNGEDRVTDGTEQRVPAPSGPAVDSNGRQHPTTSDGTPMYRQGDPEWGSRALGTGSSVARAGCAMTATAMALSRISGQTITPGQLDQYLDRNGGYSGNGLNWDVAARAAGLTANRPAWSLDTINRNLDQGRPVVVGVDYKAGSRGGANGTDHWVTITRRERDAQGNSVYVGVDPANGREFRMREQGGRLVGDSGNKTYRTTGELRTFSGGNPRPVDQTPASPTTPGTPLTPGGPNRPDQTGPRPGDGGPTDISRLGTLSARYESNGDPGTVSSGRGDRGGVSYGMYQFATNTGSARSFADWLGRAHPQLGQRLRGLNPGTQEFSNAWRAIARDNPQAFRDAQHEYIAGRFYEPARRNVERAVPGLDFGNRSRALNDVLWSVAVQHGQGGAATIFGRALAGKDVSRMSDEELIRAVYQERGKRTRGGELYYFTSSSADVQRGVANRFRNELRDALAALGQER